jgi:hypothetical protein
MWMLSLAVMRRWLAHLGSEGLDGDDPEIRLAALKTSRPNLCYRRCDYHWFGLSHRPDEIC